MDKNIGPGDELKTMQGGKLPFSAIGVVIWRIIGLPKLIFKQGNSITYSQLHLGCN